MNPIQSNAPTELRSVSTSVMKMELDQSKVDGAAQKQLIDGAGEAMKNRPQPANAPGVGTQIDVQG